MRNLRERSLLIMTALVLLGPIVGVLASFFSPSAQTGGHIWSTVGVDYLRGTIGLCVMVGLIAGIVGTASAALVSLFEFPGRRLLAFALVLPFAVPAYIMAYAYGSFLSPFGGLSQMLGGIGNSSSFVNGLPSIRSFWGAVLILSLSVYPYVYLAVRADLISRSASYVEAARSLGASPFSAIGRVLIPGARTAFLGGLALALMETAADFGVSDFFGVRTLTTGIFRTWYGLGDLTAAAQIAGGLFLVAALLLLIEDLARRGSSAEPARGQRQAILLTLSPLAKTGAIIFCLIPILLGFVGPTLILTDLAIGNFSPARLAVLGTATTNTIFVALGGAALVIIMAIFLAYTRRARNKRAYTVLIRLATLGYAIPGAVIAIGILISGAVLLKPLGLSVTQGGIVVLFYAYGVRFLTAGYNAVHGGLSQISPLTDMAARSLGASPGALVRHIHLPLTRQAILAGLVIVIIDISRELPATLLLRPFNFETLATSVYRLASDERLAAAAPMALALIAAGLVPVAVLAMLGRGK